MKLRIHAAPEAATTGNRLPHAAAKATEATAPETTEASTAASRRIRGRFAGSKKAPTKPGLQLPIRRTRPVLGSDNYDARLVRRRQSNIVSSPLGMRAPAPVHSAPEPPKERSLFLSCFSGLICWLRMGSGSHLPR
jgi:hypothetical protein